MTPQAALIELLGRVGARNGTATLVSTEELNQWPAAAVAAMKTQNLLLKARPAKSVVCPGCEQECSSMPVHTVTRANAPAASFVVCDKRSDTNRVPILAARLAQWRCDAQAVCGFVVASLGLVQTTVQRSEDGLLPIGMARGNKRTQMLCLRVHGHLALVVGADAMPLADVIGFENGSFTLDPAVIRQLVDAATTADPRHTPSTAKREARKIDTQAMYADWQKAYKALQKTHPDKSDVWHSQQIAKTAIAHGRNASTIKKHMLS
ncbi:MAG: hypothetical protein WAV85_17555 [Rhodoferax sp.]